MHNNREAGRSQVSREGVKPPRNLKIFAFFAPLRDQTLDLPKLLLILLLSLLVACQSEPETLTLATTTSTYDSGLLDAILPDFEETYGARVDVVAVGTGQALALGEAGDVDVLLTHARAREEAFVEAGYGVNRRDVMVNDFVILGPESDPAGIRGMSDAAAALQRIAETESLFVSRGDDSGTHIRELALWQAAGIDPQGDWYESAGQGMGATLTIAAEQGAYTLGDRGTFVARSEEGLDLVVLVEGDERLLNPYSVIAVNPALHDGINAELANNFIEWITSPKTQAAINGYRRNGQQLFFATAGGN